MQLGAFSVSLQVKDLAASKAFYEKLDFEAVFDFPEQNWIIMRNGDTTIGLFHEVFEENIFTFNPGWDSQNQPLESFADVRQIQKTLKERGIEFVSETDEDGTGPGNFIIEDPDGNILLFDQHV